MTCEAKGGTGKACMAAAPSTLPVVAHHLRKPADVCTDKRDMETPIELGDLGPAGAAASWENHARLALLNELYAYNHWLFDKVRLFIKDSVCEVGCGTGNITQFLLNHEQIVGIEPFGPSLEKARRRFAKHLNVEFANCRLADSPNELVPAKSFDTILCMNVLEHIEDDADSLRRMLQLCRSNGNVVVLVPAHMSAFGGLDRAAGHFRRYNRRSLRRAFEQAGLIVTDSFYMNALGYFGWLWYGRILGREQLPASGARHFNRLVPLLDAFERIIPPPFGQSLVMVGTPERQ